MTLDEFLAKHGFPGTPAGDRMKEDLLRVLVADHETIVENERREAEVRRD